METDVTQILDQLRQRDQDWDDGKVFTNPKDFLLILCELDDPQDFCAYWIYEISTGWVFAWNDEEDQERAVRVLLKGDVPVVPRVPISK